MKFCSNRRALGGVEGEQVIGPRRHYLATFNPKLGLTALLLFALGPGTLGASPLNGSEVRLGERLFFDKRFSADGTVSCGSCHIQKHAFADGRKLAIGIGGKLGTRNAPGLLDLDVYSSFFWEGRAGSLEEQIVFPLLNPIEHGLTSQDQVLAILRNDPAYLAEFKQAFGTDAAPIRMDNFARAIVAYERSLNAGPSPFDRFYSDRKSAALSNNAVRGWGVFRGKAGCASCHSVDKSGSPFTDNRFHAGITQDYDLSKGLKDTAVRLAGMDQHARDRLISGDPRVAALGRFVVTLNPKDIGLFRTPTLRNVAITAPYMHDGSIETLEEAVDWELYARGHGGGRTIVLMPEEKEWLLAFLNSLTSENPSAGR